MASRSSHGKRSTTSYDMSSTISRSSTTTQTQTRRSRPRTVGTATNYDENEIICAVSESRGLSPTVGLAFVNLTTCEAVLCQFADTQTYARTCHKIKVFDPSEIINADTAAESKLASILEENIERETDGILLTHLRRRCWNEIAGHEYMQRLALPGDLDSLKLSLAGQYFAVCSFAAVICYIDESVGTVFAPRSLRIKFEPSEGAMLVDTSTIASLELVQNLQNVKSKDCLFGVLNQTLTRMGARILKANILQPSTDNEKILKRYEAVQELSTKEAMFFAVREALEEFIDTDKVLAALVVVRKRADFGFMESSVNNVLMLKSFVDSIGPIFQALVGAESEELKTIRELCSPENYTEVRELVEYAMNTDCRYSNQAADLRNQRVYAIKVGVNGFLDVARTTYKEISSDIEEMCSQLSEQYQINLQLKFEPARQFFFRTKIEQLEDRELPAIFVNIFRKKGWLECQTLELLKINQRLKDAHAEVISLSDSSVQKLIDEVRLRIHPLFKISEAIALLDMLAGFSQLVTTQDYVKPELLEATLGIKAGRHPIREKIQTNKYIPNDVYATPQKRFQIITGCNMSGKSTYIRSIAMMTVMAQIGCFVPADYAGFPVTHQLFARVSTDDSIEANVSTFASEMRETAFILKNIEPRSLVIVDELGRGTGTTDGLAIAIAISEALIESKAYVWFVTHFRDLPRILAERVGVVSLHLAVDIASDFSRMKMMYKIAPGFEEQKFYGLAIARLMDLPREVNETATEISRYLNERNEARKSSVKTLAVAKRRRLVLALKEHLMQARECGTDNEALRLHLKKLQEEFIIRMSAIDAEVTAAEATYASSGFTANLYVGGNSVDEPIEISTDLASSSMSEMSAATSCSTTGPGPALLLPNQSGSVRTLRNRELPEDPIQ